MLMLQDINTHEESQFMLTAGIIQNDRIHPAYGRLNPELTIAFFLPISQILASISPRISNFAP